jgi:hypothetical protein
MRFGTPEMAARPGLALLLGVLIAGAPALAQEKPTLKDVLGRVQSESETPSGPRSMRSPVLLERPENSNHRLWAARPTFRRHAYVRHYPPTFAAI